MYVFMLREEDEPSNRNNGIYNNKVKIILRIDTAILHVILILNTVHVCTFLGGKEPFFFEEKNDEISLKKILMITNGPIVVKRAKTDYYSCHIFSSPEVT
jgi:hypothetical protein